jgi:hypothetical protein
MPRRHGWMLAALGWRVVPCRDQLQALLATPELAALLAAAPGAGRCLRPLCHMLGVRHPALARPARPRPQPGPAAPPPPTPRRRAAPPQAEDAPALFQPPARLLCPRLRNRWPFNTLPASRFA